MTEAATALRTVTYRDGNPRNDREHSRVCHLYSQGHLAECIAVHALRAGRSPREAYRLVYASLRIRDRNRFGIRRTGTPIQAANILESALLTRKGAA